MKQLILIALIGLILFSGCSEIGIDLSKPVDCGTDLNCFEEHLKYCEKATVEYTEEVGLGYTWVSMDESFFTLPGSKASIIEFKSPQSWCSVSYTKVRFLKKKAYSINETEIDEVWNKAECRWETNEPGTKYYSREPGFRTCVRLRD
ncbi:MAG: hypothetical protein ABH986_06955 [archaeon]